MVARSTAAGADQPAGITTADLVQDATQGGADTAAVPAADAAVYLAVTVITDGARRYEPGERLALSPDAAAPLLALGAIRER